MKRCLSRVCLVGCALCYSPAQGFFIINNSDSPKTIEVIAYLPNQNDTDVTPQTVLKKELQPSAIAEAPFALREVVLDIHWGQEKTVNTEKNAWKPIETNTEAAASWPIISTVSCGTDHRPCQAVIPPTWQLIEDESGITVTTDKGTIIHAVSTADLITKIPYRRVVSTFPQERMLMNDAIGAQENWKKIGTNYRKNEDVVIPRTWSMREEGNTHIITTNKGKELRIPIKRIKRIDPLTGKEREYAVANEDVIKKLIPYRRKNGIVTEIKNVEHIFVIEESTEKPIKMTQYNLFRRFDAHDALPVLSARGVPEELGEDHIFEISGSGYETDIAFAYAPDEGTTPIKIKRKRSLTNDHEKNKQKKEEGSSKKTHEKIRKSFREERLHKITNSEVPKKEQGS